MAQIRILLVDDHTLLRQGLRGMLQLGKDIRTITRHCAHGHHLAQDGWH